MQITKLKVLKDLVLVDCPQLIAQDGPIHIPGAFQEERLDGCVVAVGPQNHDVKPGQHVLFKRLTGREVEVNGVRCKLFQADEILALLENAK